MDASTRASDAMSRIVAAIKTLKLEGEELQTSGVSLRPRYIPYRDEEATKVIGYDASLNLRVRTTDLTAVSRVMDAALGSGANRIEGVSFEIKEAVEAREAAIRLAIAAAKRKAKTLADAMGVRLVSILNVSESGSAMPWIYTANRIENLASGDGFARSGGRFLAHRTREGRDLGRRERGLCHRSIGVVLNVLQGRTRIRDGTTGRPRV